jgi:hypothetical protein
MNLHVVMCQVWIFQSCTDKEKCENGRERVSDKKKG